MTRTDFRFDDWKAILMGTVFVAVLGLIAVTATAADDTASRLDRKVKVMERVLDEVLIQSPNVLVSSGGITRGIVLEGYGALFTLDARVGTDYFMALPAVPMPPEPGTGSSKEIIIAPQVRQRDGGREIEIESWDEWREQSKEKHAEQYKAFKSELIDALIDYGATLAELANDEWVAVAAFLDSRALFRGREGLFGSDGGDRLVVKVKMGDLRKYASGSLSRDAVIGKVVIDEK